jgi:hypothetical protein
VMLKIESSDGCQGHDVWVLRIVRWLRQYKLGEPSLRLL